MLYTKLDLQDCYSKTFSDAFGFCKWVTDTNAILLQVFELKGQIVVIYKY